MNNTILLCGSGVVTSRKDRVRKAGRQIWRNETASILILILNPFNFDISIQRTLQKECVAGITPYLSINSTLISLMATEKPFDFEKIFKFFACFSSIIT